jgi:hypothetical protein
MMASNYARRFMGTVRPVLVLHGLVIALNLPTARHNLASIGLIAGLLIVPTLFTALLLALRYGRMTALLWAPLLPVFGFIKRTYTLDSLLSLPARSLSAGWIAHRTGASVEAVRRGSVPVERAA